MVLAICVPSLPWAAEALAATAPALFWALAGKGQTCSQSSAANLAATASSTWPGTGSSSWRQAPAATISLFDLGSLEPPGLFAGNESQIPYDYADLLTAIAPRPALIYAPVGDRFAVPSAVAAAARAAKSAWSGAHAEAFKFAAPDAPSDFKDREIAAALHWVASVVR